MAANDVPQISKIQECFNKFYPTLVPIEIFQAKDGYLVVAPDVGSGTDYNDPNYLVSSDYTSAKPFDMRNMKAFLHAIASKPIWTK